MFYNDCVTKTKLFRALIWDLLDKKKKKVCNESSETLDQVVQRSCVHSVIGNVHSQLGRDLEQPNLPSHGGWIGLHDVSSLNCSIIWDANFHKVGLERLLYFKGNATRLVLCNYKVYLELENNDLYRSSSPNKPGTWRGQKEGIWKGELNS